MPQIPKQDSSERARRGCSDQGRFAGAGRCFTSGECSARAHLGRKPGTRHLPGNHETGRESEAKKWNTKDAPRTVLGERWRSIGEQSVWRGRLEKTRGRQLQPSDPQIDRERYLANGSGPEISFARLGLWPHEVASRDTWRHDALQVSPSAAHAARREGQAAFSGAGGERTRPCCATSENVVAPEGKQDGDPGRRRAHRRPEKKGNERDLTLPGWTMRAPPPALSGTHVTPL